MDKEKRYKNFTPVPSELNTLGKEIVDAAYKVHKKLGPGLLEKIYEVCFCHELMKKGIKHVRQLDIPIKYDGLTLMKNWDWMYLFRMK